MSLTLRSFSFLGEHALPRKRERDRDSLAYTSFCVLISLDTNFNLLHQLNLVNQEKISGDINQEKISSIHSLSVC